MSTRTENTVKIEPISSEDDLRQAFEVTVACFGRQTGDGIFNAVTPGWDTPGGYEGGLARTIDRWRSIKNDAQNRPNQVFLKATLPEPDNSEHDKVVGFAIWQQFSMVEGCGDTPEAMDVKAVYPEDVTEQRYLAQLLRALHKRRFEVVKDKSSEDPPALFVLDLCVVHPDYQRRGVGVKLVQWGLDEAKRRGRLECSTEASVMGRGAYTKLGFRPEGGDMVYELDEEFRDRNLPSNLFMRTGGRPI